MSTQDSKRDQIIKALEDKFKSKVISYLTGDRQGLEAQIGADAVPRFRRHLEAIGDVESLSLFLYTRGGDTNVPWRLVNLLREYCKKLNVLVPFRAHSSGTLISMGADDILMGRMGELSGIDPNVVNQFNPPDPLNPMVRLPISVEDVNAFRSLAKRFGIGQNENDENRNNIIDPSVGQVFLALASKVDPLALGNVERTHNQIRKLAADLLTLHPPELEKKNIDKIVDMLTVGLYSHSHLINRNEAIRIGLPVTRATRDADASLWTLFAEYSDEMELEKPFNAAQQLGAQQTTQVKATRAIIESIGKTDTFISEGTISRVQGGNFQMPPGVQLPPQLQLQMQVQVTVQFSSEGWRILR